MSDHAPLGITLVGATGLVGGQVMANCVGREDVRLSAIARRETALPPGIRMELFVAEPDKWHEVIEALRPSAVICALGTTWKKAGEEEDAFREVDERLVLDVAKAAKVNGVERFVAVSSVGADAASKHFYLKVKGEVERELTRIRFPRLDILRPGLLLGARDADRRLGERLAQVAAPVTNLLLHGKYRQYRAIPADTVAKAALALAKRPARGRFVHDNDAILRAARSLPQLGVE
ncbi:NAD-dependent epimerase/dehydratase family protein [Erythrobacter litoralis]|uniref:NAD(P)H-binding protein n=1 Tax=Erythrobacter litoralis TaxID=39960 RepID=UPI002435057A|nr:NAD(P)H-binding protein [Erythrobacter litoralis]MDG6078733.1 NAD-dependent epimerase/dehydratase family protein [Erythrobacter litoralis]